MIETQCQCRSFDPIQHDVRHHDQMMFIVSNPPLFFVSSQSPSPYSTIEVRRTNAGPADEIKDMSGQEENSSNINDVLAEQRENAAANGHGGETSSSSTSPDTDAAAAVATTKRRREIQSIMRDATLTDLERRLKIQQLMDGSSSAATVSACVAAVTNENVIRNNNSDGGIGSILSSLSIRGNNISNNQLIRNTINDDIGTASNNIQTNNTTTTTNNHTSSNTSPAQFGVDEESEQEAVVSCIHYERKCNIVAPCCQRTFGCRLCHDDIMSHPSSKMSSNNNAANNNTAKCKIPMDRYAISQIICKACHTLQSSKTNVCLHCQTSFAEYHCVICNIWMSNTQHPFHCSKCGMCRVGGSENYKHCDMCGMCLSVVVYESHHCK